MELGAVGARSLGAVRVIAVESLSHSCCMSSAESRHLMPGDRKFIAGAVTVKSRSFTILRLQEGVQPSCRSF